MRYNLYSMVYGQYTFYFTIYTMVLLAVQDYIARRGKMNKELIIDMVM